MPPAAKKDSIRYGPSDWPGCNEAGTSMLRGCRRGPWLGIGAFLMICEQRRHFAMQFGIPTAGLTYICVIGRMAL